MTSPDIQQQLRYHMLAREAALRGLAAMKQNKRKEAIAAQVEAERWYRKYQDWGGNQPLT